MDAFIAVGRQFDIDSGTFLTIERFVCDLYGEKVSDVNIARYKRFCVKSSAEQDLPPTKDAMKEHFRRANYQAAIHRRALDATIDAPSPDGYGWNVKNGCLLYTSDAADE